MKVISITPKINRLYPNYSSVDYRIYDEFIWSLALHIEELLIFPAREMFYLRSYWFRRI